MWAEVALPLAVNKNFSYKVPENLKPQIQIGHSVQVPFRSWNLKGVVVELHGDGAPSSNINSLKEIHSVISSQKVPPQLLELLAWLSEEYACTLGEALSLVPLQRDGHSRETCPDLSGSGALVKISPLPDSGYPINRDKFRRNDNEESKEFFPSLPYELTMEQKHAIVSVTQAFQENRNANFLLYGVTSSGKTEVYLHAIAEALRLGKQALYLVPEISICPPFLEILLERFGNKVGVWHSQVSVKDKRELLNRIFSGEVQVVVGARSALFLPLKDLGIVILDEEHDFSYKQQEKPRYHAREAAIKLMEIFKGVLVMGSATPSIESFYKASLGGIHLLELPKRVSSQSLPALRIVESNNSNLKDGSLSKELRDSLNQILWKREQAIITLNRRGFFTYIVCGACGFVFRCPHCELTLVEHKEGEELSLQCHYCFYKKKVPISCAQCGSPKLFQGGCGTQKVAAELKKKFPFARILRLDKDTARKKGTIHTTYRSFREESADILVGTQMVSQGFHFPRVTLVGIVVGETSLYHPDFRAAEKSYQWLTQASGRSGRSDLGGEVILQTNLPEHYVFKAVQGKNYRSFYEEEIQFRKELSYPPFSKLVLLRVQGAKKREEVVDEAQRLRDYMMAKANWGIEILGPGPAPREFLRGRRRWQMLVKCTKDGASSLVTQYALEFVPKSKVQVIIDVDPYDVL